MSWPADGNPRFTVSETVGAKGNITLAILDRAFCHVRVTQFRSEDWACRMTDDLAHQAARAATSARLNELNEVEA